MFRFVACYDPIYMIYKENVLNSESSLEMQGTCRVSYTGPKTVLVMPDELLGG